MEWWVCFVGFCPFVWLCGHLVRPHPAYPRIPTFSWGQNEIPAGTITLVATTTATTETPHIPAVDTGATAEEDGGWEERRSKSKRGEAAAARPRPNSTRGDRKEKRWRTA